jgi:hypothetical protein
MQTIYPVSLTPEQYAKENHHRKVYRPENCPNCDKANCLEALGYYSRFITQGLAAVLLIWVRRFRCLVCQISVSCLPDFAQPYRLVNTATVQAGLDKDVSSPPVQRWISLIVAYRKRFVGHLPQLLLTVGNAFGPCPLQCSADIFWEQLKKACGGLATATRQLVNPFRTCLFGSYRCHQRRKVST